MAATLARRGSALAARSPCLYEPGQPPGRFIMQTDRNSKEDARAIVQEAGFPGASAGGCPFWQTFISMNVSSI